MNFEHAPEREILSFQPYQYKLASWGIVAMLAVRLYFESKHVLAYKWDQIEYFEPILLTCALIFSLLVRVTLTTHKLQIKYGPFYTSEIQCHQVQEISITPNQAHLIKSKHPILTKKLFSKNTENDSKVEWKQDGSLQFVRHAHASQNNQAKTGILKKLSLQQFSTQQTDDLIRHLNQDWGFETPVKMPSDNTSQPKIHQDIGQRPLYLLAMAFIFGVLYFFIPLDAVHFGVESYLGLIPAGIIAFALCYWIIHAEQKSYPVASALMCSLVLGASLYFIALQANRWYSETHPHHAQTYQLTLTETDSSYQTWQLPPALKEKTGLNQIYINQRWLGTLPNLKVGQSYPITIYEGYLHDFWIQKETFKQLKVAQESHPE